MNKLFKYETVKTPQVAEEVNQWASLNYFNRYAVVPMSGIRNGINIPVAGEYNRNAEVQVSSSYFKA